MRLDRHIWIILILGIVLQIFLGSAAVLAAPKKGSNSVDAALRKAAVANFRLQFGEQLQEYRNKINALLNSTRHLPNFANPQAMKEADFRFERDFAADPFSFDKNKIEQDSINELFAHEAIFEYLGVLLGKAVAGEEIYSESADDQSQYQTPSLETPTMSVPFRGSPTSYERSLSQAERSIRVKHVLKLISEFYQMTQSRMIWLVAETEAAAFQKTELGTMALEFDRALRFGSGLIFSFAIASNWVHDPALRAGFSRDVAGGFAIVALVVVGSIFLKLNDALVSFDGHSANPFHKMMTFLFRVLPNPLAWYATFALVARERAALNGRSEALADGLRGSLENSGRASETILPLMVSLEKHLTEFNWQGVENIACDFILAGSSVTGVRVDLSFMSEDHGDHAENETNVPSNATNLQANKMRKI